MLQVAVHVVVLPEQGVQRGDRAPGPTELVEHLVLLVGHGPLERPGERLADRLEERVATVERTTVALGVVVTGVVVDRSDLGLGALGVVAVVVLRRGSPDALEQVVDGGTVLRLPVGLRSGRQLDHLGHCVVGRTGDPVTDLGGVVVGGVPGVGVRTADVTEDALVEHHLLAGHLRLDDHLERRRPGLGAGLGVVGRRPGSTGFPGRGPGRVALRLVGVVPAGCDRRNTQLGHRSQLRRCSRHVVVHVDGHVGLELVVAAGQVVDRHVERAADLSDGGHDPVALGPGDLDATQRLLVPPGQAAQHLLAVLLGLGDHRPALLDRSFHLGGGGLARLRPDALGLGERRVALQFGRLADGRRSRVRLGGAFAQDPLRLVEELTPP